jgi:hypothetical protein
MRFFCSRDDLSPNNDLKKRSITWFCGESWKTWSGASVDKAAGSQAAVIFLSREWARQGYEVKVYNFCKGMEGSYEGVEYVDYARFDRNLPHDILIFDKLKKHDFITNDFQHTDSSHVYNIKSPALYGIFNHKKVSSEIFCTGFFASKKGLFADYAPVRISCFPIERGVPLLSLSGQTKYAAKN